MCNMGFRVEYITSHIGIWFHIYFFHLIISPVVYIYSDSGIFSVKISPCLVPYHMYTAMQYKQNAIFKSYIPTSKPQYALPSKRVQKSYYIPRSNPSPIQRSWLITAQTLGCMQQMAPFLPNIRRETHSRKRNGTVADEDGILELFR